MAQLKEIVECMNTAPSGGFVGITDYQSENGDVVSIIGQLGCSYADTVTQKIQGLREALDNGDFEPVTVTGVCNGEKLENGTILWNSRKKSLPMLQFAQTFETEKVIEVAREILEAWENPKPRKTNKVQLTEKADGLSYNEETGSFNFTLLVQKETYKEDKSNEAKNGKEVKVKATMPESLLKAKIRKRFEKKIKSFTISSGKFEQLTIAGKTFLSEAITL